MVYGLTRGRVSAESPCHLDPDLDAGSLMRTPGWRGALGQVSAAQSHLSNNHVGLGDVFLFWGLFRRAIRGQSGSWKFTGISEHRLFGWLQVGEVLELGVHPQSVLKDRPWLKDHPHIATGWPMNNTVYVARERLLLPGCNVPISGYGVLHRGVRLTASGSTQPSLWSVPAWLDPNHGGCGMTYHPVERWNSDGTVRSAARGQEFVADVGDRVDAINWMIQALQE